MPTPIAAAAFEAGANIIQNGLNWLGNKANNDANYEQWEKMNEYNHPKNQMARYREAGLNPYLMYQSGGAGAGNAAAPAQKDASSFDLRQMGAVVNTYLDLKKKDQDIENAKLDAEGKKSDNAIKANEARFSDWAHWTGIQDAESYLSDAVLPPVHDRYRNESKKIQLDLEKIARENKDKEITYKLKQDILDDNEFNRRNSKQKYEKYGIFPDDPENVQFMKIVAKDFFNMSFEEFRKKMIGGLKFWD